MKRNQKGFGALEVLLLLILAALIAFAGWYVWDSSKKTDRSLNSASQISTIKPTQSQPTNLLKLANDSVTLSLPTKWTFEKSFEACPDSVYADIKCIEAVTITPGEKLPTIYGSGTEFFHIGLGVYENLNKSSAKNWIETDYKAGGTTGSDKTSTKSINGYDTYFWKQIVGPPLGTYQEVRYALAHNNKIVFIIARTYQPGEVNGKQLGDFRKFEPQINSVAHSIKIN